MPSFSISFEIKDLLSNVSVPGFEASGKWTLVMFLLNITYLIHVSLSKKEELISPVASVSTRNGNEREEKNELRFSNEMYPRK